MLSLDCSPLTSIFSRQKTERQKSTVKRRKANTSAEHEAVSLGGGGQAEYHSYKNNLLQENSNMDSLNRTPILSITLFATIFILKSRLLSRITSTSWPAVHVSVSDSHLDMKVVRLLTNIGHYCSALIKLNNKLDLTRPTDEASSAPGIEPWSHVGGGRSHHFAIHAPSRIHAKHGAHDTGGQNIEAIPYRHAGLVIL